MQIKDQIDAFLAGTLSLPDLEAGIERSLGEGADAGEIGRLVQDAFEAGRIPTQVFQMLQARIRGTQPAADEATRIAAAVPDEATRIAGTAVDEATRLAPAKTEVIETHAKTEVIAPHAKTEVIAADVPTEVVDYPAEFSAGTGSNWAHPEDWKDSESGPIGPGSVIKGRFRLESRLGQGGMGVVYKASDLRKEEARDANPYVAIKILSDDFRGHPQALVALQREATKAQKLAHPNVITVYDFDRDGTTVYMTMELMLGDSLDDLVKKFSYGGMAAEEAIPIIMQMAAGLEYAHEAHIVHSDFKPANVFLTREKRVKVLDFGIARAATIGGVSMNDDDEFDAGDLGAMTPGYASLEMLKGEDPHPADDVYAMAVTAYMLLTGEHPFGRQTAEVALLDNLKPAAIKGLKRRQWKAIRDGLALRREDRIPDAGAFLRQFRGPTPVRKSAYAAVAASLMLAAFFGYQATLDRPGPFPEDQREAFEAEMLLGEQLYAAGREYSNLQDVWAAAEAFGQAYSRHPKNPRAVDWLERSADTAFDLMPADALAVTVDALVCRGHLASYGPVADACAELGDGYCETFVERHCP